MPLLTLQSHRIVQRLSEGDVLAELLLTPEFSVLAATRATAQRLLSQRVSEWLQHLPGEELHRRRLAQPPVARRIAVEMPAPARSLLWRSALMVRWPYVYWQPTAGAHLAFVPALGIEVLAESEAQLQAQLPPQIRNALARREADASLRALAFLTRCPRLQVQTLPLELDAHSPKQKAIDEAAERREEKSVLAEVATEWKPVDGIAPIFQRETEVRALAEALCGRRARSVLLVGPSGVGKTALVGELARTRDALGLPGTPIWSTSGSRLIAGMSGFGMWQERCHKLMREAAHTKAIVHLDNLAELNEVGKGAGSTQGIASLLRGAIERGALLAIAECTPEQFALLERTDPYLVAAFHIQHVHEPAPERLQKLLAQAAQQASRRGVQLTPAGLDALLRLHRRFVTYSASPGRPLRFLKNLLADAQREQAIGERDVTAAFARETGLPLLVLDDAMPLDLDAARQWFAARVLGQPQPVDLMVDLLATLKAGLARGGRPIASLLFIGPTGVGKTEMAKSLATYLYRDATRLVRFDMSEYSDPLSVERLVGGSGAARGLLTQRLRDQPFTVVLFDEFEKAHPLFFDLLLQILGEGRLTDNAGRLADFSNAVVIMTSNLGAESYRSQTFGFQTSSAAAATQEHFARELRSFLRPELFNRIDRIVPFAPLDQATITGIARRELDQLLARHGMRYRGVTLTVDDGVAAHLAEQGFDAQYGARPLKRALEQAVIAPLAEQLNNYAGNTPLSGSLSIADNRLRVQVEGSELTRQQQLARADTCETLTALVEVRRQTQRLQRSTGVMRMRNEITRIEQAEKQAERRAKRAAQPVRFRFTRDTAELFRWRELVERVERLAHEAITAENAALAPYYRDEAVDTAALLSTHAHLQQALSTLLIELFEREHDCGTLVNLVLFSEYRGRLWELATAYEEVARQCGLSPQRYWYLQVYREQFDAEVHPHLVLKKDQAAPLVALKGRPEREGAKLEKVVHGYAWRKDDTAQDVPETTLGLALQIQGPRSESLFGPEAGVHRFLRGNAGQEVWVGTSSGPLANHEVPLNITRKGALDALPLRRAYVWDEERVVDMRLDTTLRPDGQDLPALLRDAMQRQLAQQAWALLE